MPKQTWIIAGVLFGFADHGKTRHTALHLEDRVVRTERNLVLMGKRTREELVELVVVRRIEFVDGHRSELSGG